ncbi:DUF3618 domain-containing protein [Lacisediminihabitans sp. H27-G8]|uniref:DUF3618 domain-containing protein n=1 Tax=Lacisediminihabitans sp. H27-G8 TaxID=3111909 RepID=UPI0038FC7517
MSDSTEQIRANIEQTRRELGGDVDALADKVTPSKIVHRQTDKLKGAIGTVKDRVMGAADDARTSASGAGSAAHDGLSEVKAKAEGNPLAVGLIAFGVGMLVASLIPASSKEKDAAAELKDRAEPLVDEVTEVAKEVGGSLKQPAQDAAEAVKNSASEAVETVKSDASTAADEVTTHAQQARDNISGT